MACCSRTHETLDCEMDWALPDVNCFVLASIDAAAVAALVVGPRLDEEEEEEA